LVNVPIEKLQIAVYTKSLEGSLRAQNEIPPLPIPPPYFLTLPSILLQRILLVINFVSDKRFGLVRNTTVGTEREYSSSVDPTTRRISLSELSTTEVSIKTQSVF
jgi:hypothetical protein